MPKKPTFASRLRQLRAAAGISQYELAKRCRLPRQTVSRLEKGDSEPSWTTVQILAWALGVDCREFQTWTPPADAEG
jgi:transcriptional regulator with XRE-family HTH domain